MPEVAEAPSQPKPESNSDQSKPEEAQEESSEVGGFVSKLINKIKRKTDSPQPDPDSALKEITDFDEDAPDQPAESEEVNQPPEARQAVLESEDIAAETPNGEAQVELASPLSTSEVVAAAAKIIKEEEPKYKKEFEDESIGSEQYQGTQLEPYKEVVVEHIDYTDSIKKELSYVEAVSGLETSGERVDVLQAIVDKMTAGLDRDIKIRIFISNKGTSANAFAMPDGTIVVTQALLSQLDTLDEVGGVIGHEIGHVYHETFGRKIRSHESKGVGWAHESASDMLTPRLLEKAGLNSFGFGESIKKVSGSERGIEHQTGLSRASQNVGMHMGIDFSTSSKEYTPIPEELKSPESSPTNLEMTMHAINELDTETLKQLVPLLHPKDLLDTISSAAALKEDEKHEGHSPEEVPKKTQEVFEIFNQHVIDNLLSEGIESDDISSFFLSGFFDKEQYFTPIKSPEETRRAIERLVEYSNSERGPKINEIIFDGFYERTVASRIFPTSVKKLEGNMYNVDVEEGDSSKIPVNEEAILDILQTLNSIDSYFFRNQEASDYIDDKEVAITSLVESYVARTFDSKDNPYSFELDKERTKEFLLKLKESGVELNGNYYDAYNHRNRHLEYEPARDFEEVLKEVYGYEEKLLDPEQSFQEMVDEYFDSYRLGGGNEHDYEATGEFIDKYIIFLKMNDISEEDRIKQLEIVFERIDQIPVEDVYGNSEGYFKDGLDDTQKKELVEKMVKTSQKLAFSTIFFTEDSDKFYPFTQDVMDKSGIDTENLSYSGLVTLTLPLLQVDRAHVDYLLRSALKHRNHYANHGFNLQNMDGLVELSYVRDVIDRRPKFDPHTAGELLSLLDDRKEILTDERRSNPFDMTIESLILREPIRQGLRRILEESFDQSDNLDLYRLISEQYPASPQKDSFLRELQKMYLNDESVTIEQKTDYLVRNFDRVGIEGMVVVAEQITTLEGYRIFREKMRKKIEGYLNGSIQTSVVAGLDVLSSEYTENFASVLATTKNDKRSKEKISTELAQSWVSYMMRDRKFDKESQKLILSANSRRVFKTFSELEQTLKGLSDQRRFAIMHKILVDKDGALTSPENREKLGDTIVDAMDVDSDFIRESLRQAALRAPADLISFPVSQMLGGLIFRGIDTNAVYYYGLNSRIPPGRLKWVATSGTNQISTFDDKIRSSTFFNGAAQKSEDDIIAIEQSLNDNLPFEKKEDGEVSDSTDAIISAVEASGALGVRSLQLSRQLYQFSPEVDKRLARSFDSRPGLNKLMFWENLNNQSSGADESTREFINSQIISVDGLLGGGSLFTTFAANVKEGDGSSRKVVLKMLNPNTAAFIMRTHETSYDILDAVAESSPENERLARMGQIFIDLSREWSLKDINDETFEEDDDLFKEVIESFNEKNGDVPVSSPDRVFTSHRLKSEDLAGGDTLNRILEDEVVSDKVKKSAVRTINSFFEHQLSAPVDGDDGEDPVHMVHSDPHVGNYMVEVSDGRVKVGVIDRGMYLKLSPKEAEVFKGLLKSGSYRHFAPKFIDLVLERNKIRLSSEKKRLSKKIMEGLRGEYIREKLKRARRFKGGVDNFALMQRMMSEFQEANLDIPLEFRLMIRNVEAMRGLKSRYT